MIDSHLLCRRCILTKREASRLLSVMKLSLSLSFTLIAVPCEAVVLWIRVVQQVLSSEGRGLGDIGDHFIHRWGSDVQCQKIRKKHFLNKKQKSILSKRFFFNY